MAILLSRHWSLGSLVLDIDYTSSYISCDNACLLRMTSTSKKHQKCQSIGQLFYIPVLFVIESYICEEKNVFLNAMCTTRLPLPPFLHQNITTFFSPFHMFNLLDNTFSWDDVELCGVFWHRHGPHLMAAH